VYEKVTNLEGVKRLAIKVRNWGRWGSNDQFGTLNFITSEKINEAAKLVKKGKIFSLGIPLDIAGPQRGYPFTIRFNPIHFMLRTGTDVASDAPYSKAFLRAADDAIILSTHGSTHIDALSHIFYEKKMWNGFDCSLVTSRGALKNGIENFRGKIVTRGVLLDVADLKEVEALPPSFEITPEDLDKCASKERVSITSGDFVLIRTGLMGEVKKRGNWGEYAGGPAPGLAIETAEWIYKKEVSGVASDTWGVEVIPNATPDCYMPWHCIVIPNIGLVVGEIFDLEELAAYCRSSKTYEFMLVIQPLPIVGGVGSPVDPYAIF
jgi:kynurenine formamidase